MSSKVKIIVSILIALIVVVMGFNLANKGASVGGDNLHPLVNTFYSGIKVGPSEDLISNLVVGTCTLVGATTLATSTYGKFACSATGVRSGDVVIVTAPDTITAGWEIIGASASTTADYIQVLIYNGAITATTTIPSTAKAGIQYQAIR